MAHRTIIDARHYCTEESLRSGIRVTIRAVSPDDQHGLVKAFGERDLESVRIRSFDGQRELGTAELERVGQMDFVNEMMLVATIRYEDEEVVVGSARYLARDSPEQIREAEIAFSVEQPYQGLGIGARLLKHLAAIARRCGISRFVADVVPENQSMLALLEHSGLPVRRQRSEDAVHVRLTLAEPWNSTAGGDPH